jgi:hypothetical protein
LGFAILLQVSKTAFPKESIELARQYDHSGRPKIASDYQGRRPHHLVVFIASIRISLVSNPAWIDELDVPSRLQGEVFASLGRS